MTLAPIVHELEVSATPERAFVVFATRMGEWWDPRYTADADTFSGIVVESGVGGRVVELHRGGTEYEWGRVTRWEPVRRFAYTSTLAQADRDAPSQVSVQFERGDGGCSVRFEHGGWNERNGSDRRKFGDWPLLLGRFAALAERGA